MQAGVVLSSINGVMQLAAASAGVHARGACGCHRIASHRMHHVADVPYCSACVVLVPTESHVGVADVAAVADYVPSCVAPCLPCSF